MNEVKHPEHYQSNSGLECKDVIKAMTENMSGPVAFHLGNAIKYLWRFTKKGTPIQDLQKAKEYIDFILTDYKEQNAMSGRHSCTNCTNDNKHDCRRPANKEVKPTPIVMYTREKFLEDVETNLFTPEQKMMLNLLFCGTAGESLLFDKETILNQYRTNMVLFPASAMKVICDKLGITSKEIKAAKEE